MKSILILLILIGVGLGVPPFLMQSMQPNLDDTISFVTWGDFTMTLANGSVYPLPEHLKDDWEQIGNLCQFKWALQGKGVTKYHQLFEVDNLTWPKGYWAGDSNC